MTEKVPSLSPGRGTLKNKWVPKPTVQCVLRSEICCGQCRLDVCMDWEKFHWLGRVPGDNHNSQGIVNCYQCRRFSRYLDVLTPYRGMVVGCGKDLAMTVVQLCILISVLRQTHLSLCSSYYFLQLKSQRLHIILVVSRERSNIIW